MTVLAVDAMEKIHSVPKTTWINIGLAVLLFFFIIVMIKSAAKMNKIVLAGIIFIFGTVFFFQWVYERNEPAFLSPAIDRIAPFFPSKGSYAAAGKHS